MADIHKLIQWEWIKQNMQFRYDRVKDSMTLRWSLGAVCRKSRMIQFQLVVAKDALINSSLLTADGIRMTSMFRLSNKRDSISLMRNDERIFVSETTAMVMTSALINKPKPLLPFAHRVEDQPLLECFAHEATSEKSIDPRQ